MAHEALADELLDVCFANDVGTTVEAEEVAVTIEDGRQLIVVRNPPMGTAAVAIAWEPDDEDEGEAAYALLAETWQRRLEDGIVSVYEADETFGRALVLYHGETDRIELARLLENLLDATQRPAPVESSASDDFVDSTWVKI
jgi:hypothetical protein